MDKNSGENPNPMEKTVIVVGPDGTHYELPLELAERLQRAPDSKNPAEKAGDSSKPPAEPAEPTPDSPTPSRTDPESLSLKENLKLVWSFRRFFIPFLPPAAALLLFAFFQGDVQLAAAHYQQRLLDSLIPREKSIPAGQQGPAENAAETGAPGEAGALTFVARLLPQVDSNDSMALTLWLAGLLVFTLFAAIASEQASVVLNQKFRLRLQRSLTEALARERKESRSSRQSGATSTIFTSDAGGLSSQLVFGILGFLENLVKIVVYCTGLFLLQPSGWIVLAVMLPLSIAFQAGVLALFHRAEAAATENSQKLMIRMQGHLINFFEMLGRFLAFGSEYRLSQRLLEMSYESAESNRKMQLIMSIRNAVSGLLLMLSLPITVFILIAAEGNKDAPLSPGLVIQANMLVGLMIGGIASLMMTPASLTQIGPGMRRVRKILDLPEPEPRPVELDGLLALDKPPQLEVEGLTFFFQRTRSQVLKGIDFSIPSGAVVGIVGPSGCGKSTLASILLGDLQPAGGRLLCNRVDITGWDLFWKRAVIGFMPTAFEFLNGTVRENILLGRLPKEAPNFDLAVEKTGVLDFLRAASPPRSLDYSIESYSGEGYLSSGQRRRVGLAQALAGPQKLLILDEPGANLNPGDMVRLAEALPSALEGRTAILITHDPDVFRTDFIIFLLGGKVAAIGSHEELMAGNPDYRNVVSRNREERQHSGTGTPSGSTEKTEPKGPPPAPGSKEAYQQKKNSKK